jgi:type I restriction-modification system DNA methylase subunit
VETPPEEPAENAGEADGVLFPAVPPPMTPSELESHLAKAADLLRGTVDQADFKAYIFPLMFFKRISDVYLEEYDVALTESGGDHEFAAFAENHRFAIPDGCLWRDVRARSLDIGQALISAFREIEKANWKRLLGIFGNAGWGNKDKLPDARLKDLIEHFSARSLSNAAVPPDVFGNAYEYLIKRTVYDPACGTGGMLIEVIQHVKRAGGRPQTLWGKLYGQEKVLATSGMARMNLFLHGIEDFEIIRGDTLREPAFFTGSRLTRFDCVIANPPFSLENWGHQAWATDKWGRSKLGGAPPKGTADWAWVQHMVTSADTAGRVAVVLPQGALFRQGAEGRIREFMLRADLIEAVIGLAPSLFYGAGLAACVLILRHRKLADRLGKVLFVNGETLFKRRRNQNTLEPEHADRMLHAYQAFHDSPGFTHVAAREEIERNGWMLNIPLYVAPVDAGERLTLDQALTDLESARQKVAQTRAALEVQLAKWA